MCPRVALLAASRPPTPKSTCKHPLLADYVMQYAQAVSLVQLPPLASRTTYTVLLRAAADAFGRRVLAEPHTGANPELLALSSIARAVARRDVRLALALHLASPTVRCYLRIEDGGVFLGYGLEFAEHIRIAKEMYFDMLKNDAASSKTFRAGGRLAAATRMSTLWSPACKRLSIHSARVDAADGSHTLVAGRRAGIAQALCEKWPPTFDATPASASVGNAFLHRWGRRFDSSDVTPPTAALYAEVIGGARHSAPGPDGLPAPAWQAVPMLSADIVLRFDDEVRRGHRLLAEANLMLQVFLPDGSIAGDEPPPPSGPSASNTWTCVSSPPVGTMCSRTPSARSSRRTNGAL